MMPQYVYLWILFLVIVLRSRGMAGQSVVSALCYICFAAVLI